MSSSMQMMQPSSFKMKPPFSPSLPDCYWLSIGSNRRSACQRPLWAWLQSEWPLMLCPHTNWHDSCIGFHLNLLLKKEDKKKQLGSHWPSTRALWSHQERRWWTRQWWELLSPRHNAFPQQIQDGDWVRKRQHLEVLKKKKKHHKGL